ncbi:MAG: putative O-methyltransferase [Calditrichaeota bacterium]|nr:putative O-methyltransferase [Calditrichota bacterium]
MAKLILDGIDDYIERHLPRRPDVLHEMESLAADEDFPIVGPQVGQFFRMLAASTGAKRVFELGSGFGYSAVWFALGMPAEGEIVLTDHDGGKLERADSFLSRLWLNGKAELLPGDALAHFRAAKGEFDIVFNDIDKQHYPEVVELAHERLRLGGFLISDNALWHGRVLDDEKDEATAAVDEYNRLIAEHEGFENVILPVRDGLSVARKIELDESLWLPGVGD